MKVAIAVDGGYVAQHFGKCQEYTLFDVVGGKAENISQIPNPGTSRGFCPSI